MAYGFASQGGYGAGPSVIPTDTAHPDVISISDAELLFNGHFERKGPDLVLTGHDGRHHLIPGYFGSEHPAALVAPNGARIIGDLVELLAGSQAPGQYAQTSAPAPTNVLGRIEKVVGDVTVMRNGVAVALHVGDAVYKSDVVQTGADSSCGIGFPDGTALNLVANTRMALNDYVYDPNGNSNDALFSLVQGGFAFVAGKVAHTGDMKITTPVATMGIRGTTGYALEQVAAVSANLGNVTMSFAVVADPGTDRVGQYDLIDQFGNVVAVVGRAGVWTNVSFQGANLPPSITTQQMNAANYSIEQELVPALVQILNSLGNLTPTPQSGPNSPGSSTPPIFELMSLPQTLQQNSGTPLTINVSVNGPNGPTSTPGTVTISTNPLAGQSNSTVVDWIAQSNGSWEAPANWSGNGIPTAPEAVDITQPIKVTVKAAESASGLFIGTGAILNVVSGGALELSNEIANFGTFQLNSSGADPTLAINGTVYLLDAGTIALKGPSAENLIVGVPGSDATLVNVDNLIIGSGTIGQGDGELSLINGTSGTVEAKPFGTDSGLLVIDTGNRVSNSGLMTAAGGGTLQIADDLSNLGLIEAQTDSSVVVTGHIKNANSIESNGAGADVVLKAHVINESGATIVALAGGLVLLEDRINNGGTISANDAGSRVVLEKAFISHGEVETSDGGAIETAKGQSTFLNVTVGTGSTIDTHQSSSLNLYGATTLDGTVRFEGDGAFELHRHAEIVTASNAELDNYGTIAGAGNIGGGNQNFVLVNELTGMIDARGQLTLTIDNDSPGNANSQPSNAVINTGVIEATGSGGLAIVNTTISNASDVGHNTGVIEVAAGSQITLDNATILHGSATIASGGEMQTASGTANTINTADGQDNLSTTTLSNGGTLLVNDNSSLTLASPDAIDNSGTITLGSTGNATFLYFNQAYAGVDGGGHIILSDNTANVTAVAQSGDQVTNFDNTVSGAGTIGAGGMVLVNDGIINADEQNASLTLDPAFLANTGVLEATKGATLIFSNTTVSNSDATTEPAGSYFFSSLNPVPSTITAGSCVNDAGQVVGTYFSGGNANGFLYDGSNFITLEDPAATSGTSANAINDSGEVVGTYSAGGIQSSFLLSNGAYTTLNDPLGANGTLANGINNAGQVVGEYIDAHGSLNGFLLSSGSYQTLDDPLGSDGTVAKGINDAGEVAGYYLDGSSIAHGFFYSEGAYTTLNDPSAANGTFAEGINDAGQVVGYYVDASNVAHGFVYSNGTYFNFDDSAAGTGAGQGTFALAINNAGEVSGYSVDHDFSVTSFLADPSGSLTSGTITADRGATIDLVSATIVDGNLTVAAANGNIPAGQIDVTGDAISAAYGATVNNSGTLNVDAGSQLDMSRTKVTGGGLDVAGILNSIGTSSVENAAITVTGTLESSAGTLNIDHGSIANSGELLATENGILVLNSLILSNSGTLDATGGGTLTIDPMTVTNAGGVIVASGDSSLVRFADATIAGGVLATGSTTSDSSGRIEIVVAGGADTSVFDGSASPVTIDGFVRVEAGANLELIGTIDNQGTIDIDIEAGANPANLEISGTVALDGSGNVTLDGSSDSIIGSSGGGTLDNASTISGAGTIGDGNMVLVNNGVINADDNHDTLILDPSTLTNNGVLEATNGGILDVVSNVTGVGFAAISGGGKLELGGTDAQPVTFDGAGTLKLDGTSDFAGAVTGLAIGDIIDLAKTVITSAVWDATTLSINGLPTTFTISNPPKGDTFFFTGDGASGTNLTVEAAPSLTICAIETNDILNKAEAEAGFTIAGRASDSSIVLEDQTVTVNIVHGSHNVVDSYAGTVQSDGTWSVNVSSADAEGLADGAYRVTANVTDVAVASAPEAVRLLTVDETTPTVTVTTNNTDVNVANGSATIGFAFSEAPTSFTTSDITAVDGTISNLTKVDGSHYTATFTGAAGTDASTAAVGVTANSWSEANGNPGAGGSTGSFTVDTVTPTVTVTTNNTDVNVANGSATISFAFSEAPTSFTTSDITAVDGTISNLTKVDGSHYTATFTGAAGTDASTAAVGVTANSWSEANGNPGAGGSTGSFTVDTVTPTVTVTTNNTDVNVANGSATISFAVAA